MTVLLYDYCELEERASKDLKVWKAWHVTIYIFIILFGIMNYAFLLSTKELLDDHCILYPKQLEYRMVELYDVEPQVKEDEKNKNELSNKDLVDNKNFTMVDSGSELDEIKSNTKIVDNAQEETEKNVRDNTHTSINVKRDTIFQQTKDNNKTVEVNNVTVIIGNKTHHLMVDTVKSLFGKERYCDTAEYIPIMSTVFAAVWATLFMMCPGGGRPTSGLRQPWRILTPALLFALVIVGITAHSFTTTNGGLQSFCAAFHNVTNSVTCAAANEFVLKSYNSSWGLAARVSASRAACAAVWVSWAGAALLLLLRCVTARDFRVRRTQVHLTHDPQQKITPYLKSGRSSNRSTQSTTKKNKGLSESSEPTRSTELVTISVEPTQSSNLSSNN